MSGSEDKHSSVEDGEAPSAFEYVAGTLSPKERAAVELRITQSPEVRKEVEFWETQLMQIQPQDERPPNKKTWAKIAESIEPKTRAQTGKEPFSWQTFWHWVSPSVAALILIAAIFGYSPQPTDTAPNTDYVAVLTDTDGKAMLTALTTGQDKFMWLKWENVEIEEETNLQLWSISKRDGQVRPLAVFASTSTSKVKLDEATWRLVTDSEFLILTEEEEGGSAIEEPSDVMLARGFCVRFKPEGST